MNLSQSIEEVRRILGGEPSGRNKLASYDDASKTLTFTYDLGGIAEGAVIENQATGELHYVWSTNESGKTAVIERGESGTSTATAPAANHLYRVYPRFRIADIVSVLGLELNALEADGLYARKTAALTFDELECGYDISAVADMISPYAITIDYSGYTSERFDFHRRNNFLRPHFYPPTAAATLHYRGEFGALPALASATDLATVTGLDADAHDVLCLGAAARLLTGKESLRTDVEAQPYSRRDEEVPVSASMTQAGKLKLLRDDRVRAEKDRLRTVWPIRRF